jgi:hypothetical protein
MESINEATGLDSRQRICRAMNFISGNLDRAPFEYLHASENEIGEARRRKSKRPAGRRASS